MNKIVITLLLAGSQLFSSTYVGVVKDASTGSPIADANIIISGNEEIGLTTNEKGEITSPTYVEIVAKINEIIDKIES